MPDYPSSAGWVPQLYPQYGWPKSNPPLPQSQGLAGSPSSPDNNNHQSSSSPSSTAVSSSDAAARNNNSRFEDAEEK